MYKGKYYIYIRNSLWGVTTLMSEVPELDRFSKKNGPQSDQFIFILY